MYNCSPEHRQSSLFLHPDDPTYGIAAFHQPGDSLIETTAHMERTKTIILRYNCMLTLLIFYLSSLREAGGAHCSFNAMFPVDRTTRKQASCAFTGVLGKLALQSNILILYRIGKIKSYRCSTRRALRRNLD